MTGHLIHIQSYPEPAEELSTADPGNQQRRSTVNFIAFSSSEQPEKSYTMIQGFFMIVFLVNSDTAFHYVA